MLQNNIPFFGAQSCRRVSPFGHKCKRSESRSLSLFPTWIDAMAGELYHKSLIRDGLCLVMKRTLWNSWMFNDSKREGSICRNVSFHVLMAGSIQVVVYWLWHPLSCRGIPIFCSNTLSAWAVISWASSLLNSHPMCPWKGLNFSLRVPPRWCNLPYFDLPLTLALYRVIFSHFFVSCLHKRWGPEKGPFFFLGCVLPC